MSSGGGDHHAATGGTLSLRLCSPLPNRSKRRRRRRPVLSEGGRRESRPAPPTLPHLADPTGDHDPVTMAVRTTISRFAGMQEALDACGVKALDACGVKWGIYVTPTPPPTCTASVATSTTGPSACCPLDRLDAGRPCPLDPTWKSYDLLAIRDIEMSRLWLARRDDKIIRGQCIFRKELQF